MPRSGAYGGPKRKGVLPPSPELFSLALFSMWLLHLHNTVKMQPFSPTFPLAESIAKAFCRLFLWNFKEKSISHFPGYSLFLWPCHSMWLFYLHSMGNYRLFLWLFCRWAPCLGYFTGYSFGISRNQAQPFPVAQPFKSLCQSRWLFCFSNILKIYAFSPIFPLVGSMIGGFYWFFLWNFKK